MSSLKEHVEDMAVEDIAVEDMAVEDVAVEDMAVEDMAVEGMAAEDMAVEDMAVEDMAVEDMAVEDMAVLKHRLAGTWRLLKHHGSFFFFNPPLPWTWHNLCDWLGVGNNSLSGLLPPEDINVH